MFCTDGEAGRRSYGWELPVKWFNCSAPHHEAHSVAASTCSCYSNRPKHTMIANEHTHTHTHLILSWPNFHFSKLCKRGDNENPVCFLWWKNVSNEEGLTGSVLAQDWTLAVFEIVHSFPHSVFPIECYYIVSFTGNNQMRFSTLRRDFPSIIVSVDATNIHVMQEGGPSIM